LEILRKRDAWGTFLGLFCVNYAWYFLLTWLPSYLVMERHFSAKMMAIFGSMPFWGVALSSIAGGWASDLWIARGGSPTRVRKTFVAGGMLLSTLILPAVLVRDPMICMVLLIAASLSFGLFTSNIWAITQTLAGPGAAGNGPDGRTCSATSPASSPLGHRAHCRCHGPISLAFVAVCAALVLGAVSISRLWVT
jgi:hypothetical protein